MISHISKSGAGLYPTPFTKNTINNIYKDWLDIFKRKESGSILNIPKRDQVYRINQFVNRNNSPPVSVLDLTSHQFEDPDDIEKFIISRIVIVMDADNLLLEKPHLLSFFDTFAHKNNTSVLYFFQRNITADPIVKSFGKLSSLYQNIVYYRYWKNEDMEYYLQNYLQNRFEIQIPEKVQKIILDYYYKNNSTIILVTHDIEDAIALSDQIFILSEKPSYVKKEIIINLGLDKKNPLEARLAPKFNDYFKEIWEELKYLE